MKKLNYLLLSFAIIFIANTVYSANKKFTKGIVVIEAENTKSPLGEWKLITPDVSNFIVGAGNNEHLEFTGGTINGGKPSSALEYGFTVPASGTYRLLIVCNKRLEGASGDKCNDGWVKMTGNFESGNDVPSADLKKDEKFFGGAANGWGWAELLDWQGHIKRPALYNFKAREKYTFTLSGRSIRWNVDKIVLFDTLKYKLNEVKKIIFPSQNSIVINAKPKVWIYTDMSDKTIKGKEKEGSANDPDDMSAMAGYLLMSNEFETLGIVVTSTHRKEHKTSPDQGEWATKFYGDAYKTDFKKLNKKIKGYQKNITFTQSCIKESAERFNVNESYADLTKYTTVSSLVEAAKKETDIINVLCWGSLTEPAILVKHCQETGKTELLKKLRFIAHWTNSPLHQGTPEQPWKVANCNEDVNACNYLKEQAFDGKITYYELGAIGQHGIVSGSQFGNVYYNQFKVSALGKIFAEGKFAHNGVDDSDAATYWTLLGNWGVNLNDVSPKGINSPEIEKANEEKFLKTSKSIREELLRRVKIAAK